MVTKFLVDVVLLSVVTCFEHRTAKVAQHVYEPSIHYLDSCPEEYKYGAMSDELREVVNKLDPNFFQCVAKQFGHVSVYTPVFLTSLELDESEYNIPGGIGGGMDYSADRIRLIDLAIEDNLRDSLIDSNVLSVVAFPNAGVAKHTLELSNLFTKPVNENYKMQPYVAKGTPYLQCADTCKLGPETGLVRQSPNCMDLRDLVLEHVVEWDRGEFVIVNIGAANTFIDSPDNIGQQHGGDPLSSLFTNQFLEESLRGLHMKAFLLDANQKKVDSMIRSVEKLRIENTITPIQSFVTTDTITPLVSSFVESANAERIDIFKIDIDSFECAVLLSFLKKITVDMYPRVVVIELQALIPPPFRYALQESEELVRASQNWTLGEGKHIPYEAHYAFPSCSLSYATDSLRDFGYYLYKFNGDNAVFINEHIANGISEVDFPVDEKFCYYIAPIHAFDPWLDFLREWMMDPSQNNAFRKIYHNLTAQHRAIGLRDGYMPFTLDIG